MEVPIEIRQCRRQFEQANLELPTQLVFEPKNLEIAFYHTDHLGTPLKLINASGKELWQAEADDWKAVTNGVGETDQPIRFQGQFEDEESGLYYNRNRYYEPELGRYVTHDPIGFMAGLHTFNYPSDPINRVDPLGLFAFVLPAIPVILEGAAAIGSAILATAPTVATATAVVGTAAVVMSIPGDTPINSQQTAEDLTAKHKAAAACGDKTSPHYGGNCTPNEYDRLSNIVEENKANVSSLGKCLPDMVNSELKARMNAFNSLKNARQDLNNKCFNGGDSNHRDKVQEMVNGYNRCQNYLH